MKTILVAEGFQNARKALVNALARNGYNTLEAADGAEALGMFDGRAIDLLVADFKLVTLNGAELANAVRTKGQYKNIPVLVLSGETKQDTKTDATPGYITAWIKKPFDLERFMKLVAQYAKHDG